MNPIVTLAPAPFDSLFRAQRAAVVRLLVGMVGPDAAEDCFQETFLKVLRAWPPPVQGATLDAWVLTIAHRTALDHLRRERVRATGPLLRTPDDISASDTRGSDALVPRELHLADEDHAIERTIARLDAGELWRAVRVLPDAQRVAVVLHVVLDMTHARCGEVLGCSEDAARRRYADALTTLRRTWAPHHAGAAR